jgi:hypothetical protein
MQGAVTWEVLQWVIYGAIALVVFTAGSTAVILFWFERKFNQIRSEGNTRSEAVIHAVEQRASEIRSEVADFKEEVREDFAKIRSETAAITNDWHEQNTRIRERIATVESIVARMPRGREH